jgi:hypothetical protein
MAEPIPESLCEVSPQPLATGDKYKRKTAFHARSEGNRPVAKRGLRLSRHLKELSAFDVLLIDDLGCVR